MLLFWERGYDAVATRDLTGAMGITAPSLYHAFTNKRALFEEAVEAYGQRYGGYIDDALQNEPDARSAVAALLLGAVHQQTLPGRPHGCLIISGATNYSPASAEVAAGLRERRAHTAARIAEKIRTDIARGALPPGIEAGPLATYAMSVWNGIALLARDGAAREELEAAVGTAMQAWPGPLAPRPDEHCHGECDER